MLKVVIATMISIAFLFSIILSPLQAEENQLSESQRSEIISCLQDDLYESQWVSDILYYNDVISCFNLSKKEYNFYSTSIFEDLSNILIDLRNTDKDPNYYDELRFSSTDFIHINTEFLKWIDVSFVSLANNPEDQGFKSRKAIFNKYKQHIRPLVYAYEYLFKYKDIELESNNYLEASQGQYKDNMLEFLERYKPDKAQDYSLDELEFKSDDAAGYPDNINRFRYSVGFWLRRKLDGTLIECRDLLKKTINIYDPEWVKSSVLE
jgi:hypothetical protein